MVHLKREVELAHLLLHILIPGGEGVDLRELHTFLQNEFEDLFLHSDIQNGNFLKLVAGLGLREEAKSQLLEADPGMLENGGIGSSTSYPLVSQTGENIGVFIVAHDGTRAFLPHHLELFRSLTSGLSVAWECARAYRELSESEKRLRFFVENVPVSVAMFDKEMRYLAASHAWQRYFRLPDELLGRYHYEVFPDIPQEWREIHQRCLKGATESSEEDFFLRSTGEQEWMRWLVSPWRNVRGEIAGIFIFTESVNEEHKAREQLKRSEAEYRSLFEGSPIGHAECSLDTFKFVRVNKRYVELMGYSEEELLTMGFPDITHPDDLEKSRHIAEKLRSGVEDVIECEKRYVRRDGSAIWCHTYTTLIRDEKNTAVRLLASVTDSSEKRRVEESLRESERLYRAIAAHLPSGAVFIIDRDLCCKLAEGQVLREVGFVPSHLEGRRLLDVFGAELGRACEENCIKVHNGESFKIEHTSFRRHFVSHGVPLKDSDGNIYAALVVSYDITDRKRAERELAESRAQLTTLFDVVPIGLAVAEDVDCSSIRMNKAHARDLKSRSLDSVSLSNPLSECPYVRVYRNGIELHREELPLRRAARGEHLHDKIAVVAEDESMVEFEVFAAPLVDRRGAIYGSVGAFVDTTERTAREKALEESEERYKAFLTNSSEGVFRLELTTPILLDSPEGEQVEAVLDGSIAECNDAFAMIYDFLGKEEVLGRRLQEILGGTSEELRESARAIVKSGYRVVEAERRRTNRSGRNSYYSFSLFGVMENGQIRRIWGTVRDITGRKRAEHALRRKEAEFRALADNITQLAWMADENGEVFWYNQRWFDYTGTTLDEMQGYGWQKVHHQDYVDSVTEKYRSHFAQGIPWEDTFPLRGKDGEYRWFLSRAVPFREGDTGPVRWFGTNTDITEQRNVEHVLRENEERLHLALQAGRTGVWDWNVTTGRVTWSRETCQVFGLNREGAKVSVEEFFERVHEDDRAKVKETVEGAIRAGDNYSCEFRVVRPDGDVRWIVDFGIIRRDSSGRAQSLIGTITDRTEEWLANEALREADRRKDEFLATLAHELRNPLAPLRTGLQVVRQSPKGSPMSDRALEMMERQLVHMVHLIDDLLDVSRISRGKIELKREIVSIQSVIESATDASRPNIEGAKHCLQIDLPSEPILLEGDPTRLAQVISNLLNNAAKYTLEGGSISLRVISAGDKVNISVADNGVGISDEMLPLVFDMFTQVGKTLDRAQGGLGIGLSIVKNLVSLHGGSVRAESEGVGKGSVFTVELPRLPAASVNEHQDEQVVDHGGAKPLKILIVDDNVDGAESLSMLLQLSGHLTRIAHNGPDALNAAREFQPRAIFLDIGLPGMSGHEVARRLRTGKEAENVVLIALTGWGSEEDKRQSKEAGFDYHLTKPIDFDAVEQVMSTFD